MRRLSRLCALQRLVHHPVHHIIRGMGQGIFEAQVVIQDKRRLEMKDHSTRAEISEKVIQLFVDIIGFIDRSEVTEQTDFIHDFDIIDDDLTCFVMQIKWQFKLQATQEDWDHITTIKQIVDLIERRSSPL